jgi:quinol monooxygenase YgiN
MIHVVATIALHPGTRPAVLDVFRWLTPLVRAEVGCVEYQATVDVPTTLPTQDGPRPDVVTVIEKWDGVEALYAHGAAPHMVEYRARVKEFVAGVKLQVTEPA